MFFVLLLYDTYVIVYLFVFFFRFCIFFFIPQFVSFLFHFIYIYIYLCCLEAMMFDLPKCHRQRTQASADGRAGNVCFPSFSLLPLHDEVKYYTLAASFPPFLLLF